MCVIFNHEALLDGAGRAAILTPNIQTAIQHYKATVTKPLRAPPSHPGVAGLAALLLPAFRIKLKPNSVNSALSNGRLDVFGFLAFWQFLDPLGQALKLEKPIPVHYLYRTIASKLRTAQSLQHVFRTDI